MFAWRMFPLFLWHRITPFKEILVIPLLYTSNIHDIVYIMYNGNIEQPHGSGFDVPTSSIIYYICYMTSHLCPISFCTSMLSIYKVNVANLFKTITSTSGVYIWIFIYTHTLVLKHTSLIDTDCWSTWIIQVLDPLVLYKKLHIISPMVSPAHIPSHHPIIPVTSSPTVASGRGRTNMDRWLFGKLWWGPAIREVWFVSGQAVQHYLVVSLYLENIF